MKGDVPGPFTLPRRPRVPAEPPRRAPVPVDPALPRLPILLDPDAIAPFLYRSLGPDAPFPDVRVLHLRYQPGKNIVVRYDVGLDGRRHDAVAMITARRYLERRAHKPENVALARLVDDRSPAPMPLHYEPELDSLIHWYPLDLELPALAEPPTRLFGELEAAGVSLGEVGGEPATLAYRPRRAAVLRVGQHVLKIYAKQTDFAAATAGLRAAGSLRGVRTAALEGHLPARLVTVQPLLSGARPSPAAVAPDAGELLRKLQSTMAPVIPAAHQFHQLVAARASARLVAASLPALPIRAEAGERLSGLDAVQQADLAVAMPSQQLAVAEASARFVAAILPVLGVRLEALVRELEATVPSIDRLVLSHGDFSARQLIVSPDGLALIDLDAMCLAPAALDPTTYAAHLVFGEPDDLAVAYEVLEELLDGYGGRPVGLSWYLATSILRHSRYPFRCFDEHWPGRVEGMVTAAEAALDR
jgi:hypothetical protein